jgi:hypothetical protein
MKKEIKILFIGLILGVLLASCKEPGPVEIIDEENLDIELLSPRPDENVYSTPYDSTGILEPASLYTTLISVSGIQNTYKNISINSIYDAAFFFDRSKPIYDSDSRIVGYHCNPLGDVFFNSEQAAEKEWRVRYRLHGEERDTLLGKYHVLTRLFSPGGLFAFPYDSYLNFELKNMHGQGQTNSISFAIPTPEKVTGRVELTGSRRTRDIKMDLNWNANSKRDARIEIVVGGYEAGKDGVFPILRFRTADDGFLSFPPSLLRTIPFNRFNALVITFQRKLFKRYQHDKLPDNHIVAQSIHNIKIDVPE